MTKTLLGFQLLAASFIHFLCCGLPLLISLGGGLGIFIALQTITPMLICLQIIVFGFTLYQLYKPANNSTIKQRIVFWMISLLSLVFFLIQPTHWFKSEETKLKQAQIERFLKHKTR